MKTAPLISVRELQQKRTAQQPHVLLDVREGWETDIAALPDSLHIPLNQIPPRLKELDANSTIIVICKVGGRSQMVANFLLNQGFVSVFNLAGGIDAWSREIDPSLPTY